MIFPANSASCLFCDWYIEGTEEEVRDGIMDHHCPESDYWNSMVNGEMEES